ncbi:MAG TPA: ABC transporter permease [Gaiellaceae bacterium]|nr:ABC transporter permease [Gaiellaceae bacterium]
MSSPAVATRTGDAPIYSVRRRESLHILRGALKTFRGATGALLTLGVVGVAALGPLLAPHGGTDLLGAPFQKPGSDLPLGADELGRDVLSRVLYGGWELLLVAAAGTALGIVVGTAAGVVAAYVRGSADALIMRTVDVLLAFPQLVFVLLLVSVIGPKTWLLVVGVGLSHAPQVARVLRSAALDVSERDYVKAVEILGVPPGRVMRREVVPSLITPLMVETGLRMTYSIIIIAGLSFVGFGLQPPSPNWGLMINENRIGLTQNSWPVLAPALLVALLTVGLNMLTDAIARVALGVDRAERAIAAEALGAEPTVDVA